MHDYACYNGSLVYDKTDDVVVYTDEEWEAAIVLPENRLMEPGTETQRQMVYVQDFMGQYNSYLQGANTQIANSSRTLAGLARGGRVCTAISRPGLLWSDLLWGVP